VGVPCPDCASPLASTLVEGAERLGCAGCGGALYAIGVLGRTRDRAAVESAWARTAGADAPIASPCPRCAVPLREAPLEGGRLRGCRRCFVAWLDRASDAALPPARLATDGRLEVAAAAVAVRGAPSVEWHGGPIAVAWKRIATPLVVEEAPPVPGTAWLTGGLVAVLAAAGLATLPDGIRDGETAFLLDPRVPSRLGGLPFLSTFFIHGSPGELFHACVALLLLGPWVEAGVGRARMLALLAFATVAANLVLVVLPPGMPGPVSLGALPGVAAVVTCAVLVRPRARLPWLLGARMRWSLPLAVVDGAAVPAWALGLAYAATVVFRAIAPNRDVRTSAAVLAASILVGAVGWLTRRPWTPGPTASTAIGPTASP
jgi:membrane associated rhomboid family serine protease